MRFAFDLWAYDDVSEHADAILAAHAGRHHALRRRLAAEYVEAFQRWTDTGQAP